MTDWLDDLDRLLTQATPAPWEADGNFARYGDGSFFAASIEDVAAIVAFRNRGDELVSLVREAQRLIRRGKYYNHDAEDAVAWLARFEDEADDA